MCPESFGGVTFDLIYCMSLFNHVPSGDTLCRDTISSFLLAIYIVEISSSEKHEEFTICFALLQHSTGDEYLKV